MTAVSTDRRVLSFGRLAVGPATTTPPPEAAEPFGQVAPIAFSTLELAILDGLAKGMSSAEIADRLHYSRQAISYHIGQMMTRSAVRNRTALVALAYERRFLPLAPQARVPDRGGQPAG